MKGVSFVFGLCFGMIMLVVLWGFWVTAAKAHNAPSGWQYDLSCCSDQDCGPVEDGVVTERKDGIHVEGHGVLSETDPRVRWSRDGQDHLCLSPTNKLLCVYRKPKGF